LREFEIIRAEWGLLDHIPHDTFSHLNEIPVLEESLSNVVFPKHGKPRLQGEA
jgi:hypothetical protein